MLNYMINHLRMVQFPLRRPQIALNKTSPRILASKPRQPNNNPLNVDASFPLPVNLTVHIRYMHIRSTPLYFLAGIVNIALRSRGQEREREGVREEERERE